MCLCVCACVYVCVCVRPLRPSPKSPSGRVGHSCLFTGYHLCVHYQKLQGAAVLNQTQDRESQVQRPLPTPASLTDQSLPPLGWSFPGLLSSLYPPFLSVCLSDPALLSVCIKQGTVSELLGS